MGGDIYNYQIILFQFYQLFPEKVRNTQSSAGNLQLPQSVALLFIKHFVLPL